MPFPYEALLLIFAIVLAAFIIWRDNLFAATMLSGVFSLACTGIYTLVDAVDVAFTEASVGAGISTVLFLGALALTGEKEQQKPRRNQVAAVGVSLATLAVLLYGTLDMPIYGDAGAPIHHHVVPRYLNDSPKEVGLPNFVTSILASYRGYDTLGETTVVLTAAVGVLVLLGGALPLPRRPARPESAAPNQASAPSRPEPRAATSSEGGAAQLEHEAQAPSGAPRKPSKDS